MSTGDTDSTAVLDAVRGSLDGVVMSTPVSQIVAAGRAHRRRRRLIKSAGASQRSPRSHSLCRPSTVRRPLLPRSV